MAPVVDGLIFGGHDMGKLSPNGLVSDWRERLQAQIDKEMQRLAEIRQAEASGQGVEQTR